MCANHLGKKPGAFQEFESWTNGAPGTGEGQLLEAAALRVGDLGMGTGLVWQVDGDGADDDKVDEVVTVDEGFGEAFGPQGFKEALEDVIVDEGVVGLILWQILAGWSPLAVG